MIAALENIGTYSVPADVAEAIRADAELLATMTDADSVGYVPADSPCGEDCQNAINLWASSDGTRNHPGLNIERLPYTAQGIARLVAIYIFG